MNPANLDWELCRSLLAILRTGSLSGAARALGVAHPTIRRHLDEMEAAIGASLFVRSPTGLAATELALALREPAETMEAAFGHLVRTSSAAAGALTGTVRITASEVVGVEVLPPILAAIQAAYPGLIFELHLTDRIEDLTRNEADIAIRMARPVQSDLVARRAAVLRLGLFAHEHWLERHTLPSDLADLVARRCLIGEDTGTTIALGLASVGISATRADYGFRSDSNLVQLAALRAGIGVGVCQLGLAARQPALIRIIPEVSFALEAWLVSHPAQRNLARIGVTLDGIAAGLASYAAVGAP